MDEIRPNAVKAPEKNIGRPTSVTVFGVLNIVVGCYFLVRSFPGLYKIMGGAGENPENITGWGIVALLLIIVGVGLAIWLIVLGIGLLTMKRWARRGSVLYACFQVVIIVITLGTMFFSLSRMNLLKGWLSTFLDIDSALALIHWIYMVLLLIFMKTTKVKKAFAAVGG